MILRNAIAFVSALLFAAVTVVAQAAQPRLLGWDDLVPPGTSFDDPFTELSPDQLYLLNTVANVRERKAAGREISALTIEEAKDALAELEGELIRMPGYVLPLEFAGARSPSSCWCRTSALAFTPRRRHPTRSFMSNSKAVFKITACSNRCESTVFSRLSRVTRTSLLSTNQLISRSLTPWRRSRLSLISSSRE